MRSEEPVPVEKKTLALGRADPSGENEDKTQG